MPGTRSKKANGKRKRSNPPQDAPAHPSTTAEPAEQMVAAMSIQDKRLVLSDVRKRYRDTGLVYPSDEIRPGLTVGEFSFFHTLASAKKRYEKHQGQKKKADE